MLTLALIAGSLCVESGVNVNQYEKVGDMAMPNRIDGFEFTGPDQIIYSSDKYLEVANLSNTGPFLTTVSTLGQYPKAFLRLVWIRGTTKLLVVADGDWEVFVVDFSANTISTMSGDILREPKNGSCYMTNAGAKHGAFGTDKDTYVVDYTSDPPTFVNQMFQDYESYSIATYFETDYVVLSEKDQRSIIVYDSSNSYSIIKTMQHSTVDDFSLKFDVVQLTSMLVSATEDNDNGNFTIQIFDYTLP